MNQTSIDACTRNHNGDLRHTLTLSDLFESNTIELAEPAPDDERELFLLAMQKFPKHDLYLIDICAGHRRELYVNENPIEFEDWYPWYQEAKGA